MKNWKKNAVVASILVFVCAGIYLNWMYTQDKETADLTDTLNQEKILGASTLVMSQTGDLAGRCGQGGPAQTSGQTTDYFAAVRLSRQPGPGQRRFHPPGGHGLWRGHAGRFRIQRAGRSGRNCSV